MTSLKFFGGCKTIGSSAYLVEEDNAAVLLDYGASFNGHPTFAQMPRPKNLTVALSHAHLDHSGGLPLLFTSGSAPVYMTEITRELIRILLKDMLKLSNYYLPYEKQDIDRLFRRIKLVDYKEPITLKHGITLTFYDAGHIPGSAAILVETPAHQVLYTGDINTIDTQLHRGARIPPKEPDTVIIESTYALTPHDPRASIEDAFIDKIAEIVDNGGFVLVPAFAVARAQEILCILTKHKIPCPVYMDGMAREASRVFLRHPMYFRKFSLLQRALQNTEWIQSRRQRTNVLKYPGVMVAPAGMLRGGTATWYLSQLMHDPKNAVLLVGYQIRDTPGRVLLEQGIFDNGTGIHRVKARVQLFDFSAHAGQTELVDLARSFSRSEQMFTVHGEAEACIYLAATLREQHHLRTHVAETGQSIELSD